MLDDLGDDVGAARGGVRDVDLAVGQLNDGRGDRGEWPGVRLDEVGRGGGVAESVGRVRDAEV